jgi:UPF0271 protein
MGYVVDINCDMGESFGAYTMGSDETIIRFITSSNIACGFHASDPMVMDRTVRLCKDHGVMAGAHPGYPDILGFGRRFMEASPPELVSYVIYQAGALKGFLDLHGLQLQHVKLHGALYNYLIREEKLSLEIAVALKKAFGDVIFLTLGTGRTAALKKTCKAEGVRLALEAFPDRMYTDEGELMPRKQRDAVLRDREVIARRAVRMVKEKGIESVYGRWIDMDIDTLCIHGDNHESVEAARQIHGYAIEEGIELKSLGEFV